MKKLVLILLVLCSFISFSLTTIAVENPAFSANVSGEIDDTQIYNEQNTFVLSWRIVSNSGDMTLSNVQGLRLAYDTDILQLLKWDGSDVVSSIENNIEYTAVADAGLACEYGDILRVYISNAASGEYGYVNISLGEAHDKYACLQGKSVLLAQLRFAFRSGKTADDLNSNSVRCQSISDLNSTAQSSVMLINTDEDINSSYEYLRQSNDTALGGDRLNAPTVTYPGSDINEEVNSKLSTVSIPGAAELPTQNESKENEANAQKSTVSEENAAIESNSSNRTSSLSDSYHSNEKTLSAGDSASNKESLYVIVISAVLAATLIAVLLVRRSGGKNNTASDDHKSA